jgi:adenine phosphoribosyltransferase
MERIMNLEKMLRTIPDYPTKGIMYRDITTVLKDPAGLKNSITEICNCLQDIEFDTVIGPESRGFIFGVPVAVALNKGFVPARKKGKLPAEVVSKSYDLEYGKNTIEIHKDALYPGQKIVIVDDLLATGGTCKAVSELAKEAGAEVVASVFLIELGYLKGREVLEQYGAVHSIVKYEE